MLDIYLESLDFPLPGDVTFQTMCIKWVQYWTQKWILNRTWAASSEFVSSSIPSWHILTAHAQPFRGARDLAFCLKVPLDSLLVWASSEGSDETARMRRLAWTFAARIGDKYQIRLTRSMYFHWIHQFWVICILKQEIFKLLYFDNELMCIFSFVYRVGPACHVSSLLELWSYNVTRIRQLTLRDILLTVNTPLHYRYDRSSDASQSRKVL